MQKLSFGRACVPSCMTSGLNSEVARDAADFAELTSRPHKDPVDSPSEHLNHSLFVSSNSVYVSVWSVLKLFNSEESNYKFIFIYLFFSIVHFRSLMFCCTTS